MSVDPTLVATIVCSWGGQYDTSYLTLEEAEAIAETCLTVTEWTALATVGKVSALISASRDIDRAYKWIGGKYFYYQNLEFPRTLDEPSEQSVPDESFYEMLATSRYQTDMKRDVKIACFEQALWLARISGRDKHAENQARGITSVSEGYGSISESYGYKGTATKNKLSIEAHNLLKKYRSQPRLLRA